MGETLKRLSPKQQRIVRFIHSFCDDRGYPPTIRDIVRNCGISSTSVVSYNLKILEREGYLRRHSELARGIELVARSSALRQRILVPIIGQIAAGQPIPVPTADTWDVTPTSDTLEVTQDLTRGRSEIYALRVQGWSMVDALVNDGDIVLMQHVNSVDNGEVAAVWLKAEREVTLKRFYSENTRIRLQPANSQMQAIYVAPGNIEIQGRVIAVIRHLE
jgi:repressor LexA